MSNKIKVFLLSDNLLAPSGVGTQSKYIVEALLRSGKFQVRQFAGAIKHEQYQPLKTQEWGDDLIIFPVDHFGTKESVRSFIRQEKPDIMVLFTDPRFFVWLFEMANEIQPLMPILYYTIWDAGPPPTFNYPFYTSCDHLACISKLTHRLISEVVPDAEISYLPHAVNDEIFKSIPQSDIDAFREKTLPHAKDKVVFFFNGRNARRKATGTMIFWFNEFLKQYGKDKACLLMHTEVKDPNGPDLEEIVRYLDLVHGEVMFSQEKLPMEALAMMYNAVDCTLSISEAEGFGLPTLESLSCGTPIIVTKTGGMQEQVTDGKEEFGFGIEPKCKMYAGSQDIPWIQEDRILEEDFVSTLKKFCDLSPEQRKELGRKGQEHVNKNYNFKTFGERWVKLIEELHEKHGSWDTRKNYSPYDIKKY